MAIPSLPASGSTSWYAYAQGLDSEVRNIKGPAPSGGDDTAALTAAILAAQSVDGRLLLQAGTYNVTGVIATAQSGVQPRVVGRGLQRTIINITGSGSGFRLQGGAAATSGGGFEDIGFNIGTGATGIEFRSACFTNSKRLVFYGAGRGVLFHNAVSGDFTEFNTLEDCRFLTDGPWAEYKVTSGNDSFHGSGFQNCTFNQSATSGTPQFIIGAGARLYNASLDGTFFGNTPAVAFVNAASATNEISTFGHIRAELVVGNYKWANSLPLDWDHAGDVTCLGQTIRFNADNTQHFSLVDWRIELSDGSISRKRKPKQTQWTLTTGGNNTCDVDNGASELISVNISGPNYEQERLLHVHRNAGDNNGNATVLATGRDFNVAGYGAITFTVSGGRLVVTNATWPASGLVARIGESQILGRQASELL